MNQSTTLLSDKKLAQISTGRMWDFHGGVHPIQNKEQSNHSPISDPGIPEELIIVIEDKGQFPTLLVKVGDHVLKGQPLTKVVGALVVQHASSSGTVKAIEPRTDCHPSGLAALSIVIETDGLDRPFSYQGFENYRQEDPATLVAAIQQAGIVGLGGASFPSHLKLTHIENRLLIINAIECEPYITADDRLIQEHADEIIEGIQILQHILKPKLTVFAIEDNKPEAIQAFTRSLKALSKQARDSILIRIIPTRYPSGSAKQLIEILTGEQTPINKHASELGIVMNNVGTTFAIKEAILNGKPLVSRIVTLTGDAFAEQGNARVRLGTPIQYLLESYRFSSSPKQQLIIGGPMMGFTVNDVNMPVSTTCNCILAPSIKEMPEPEPEMSCIRCSECAEACPVELLPQQLLWYSQSEDHQKLEEYDLSACIECGACAFVCPSHIPLVDYYRVSKAQIKSTKQEADKAAIARQRHEDREQRLENEKQQRQLKHKLAAEKRQQQMKDKNGGEDLVVAALARAKAKKSLNSNNEPKPIDKNEAKPSGQNSQVAAAIARAKAKKLAATEKTHNIENTEKIEKDSSVTENDTPDPRKAVIAAAVARAKAKKLAVIKNTHDIEKTEKIEKDSAVTENDTPDPRKAAIAAAVARAKAKKLAVTEKTHDIEKTEQIEKDSSVTENDTHDPRKAAIAAAVARAKAKKLAVTEKTLDIENTEKIEKDSSVIENDTPDPRKAAIAAAVARAKAKKLAATENTLPIENTEKIEKDSAVTENDTPDPRKAAIAAAVARAKAKKLAVTENTRDIENTKEIESDSSNTTEPDNAEVIKQRTLRKEQARLHRQQLLADKKPIDNIEHSIVNIDTSVNNTDAKKAQIAAVIAKAKKQAQKDQ